MIAQNHPNQKNTQPKNNEKNNGSHAPSSLLGTHTSIASAPLTADENLTLRYRMQDAARRLIPHERVSGCMRKMLPDKTSVQVMYNASLDSAHFAGVQICGALWQCPVCAAKISEVRRRELSIALANTTKHKVFITYTFQHNYSDKLADTLKNMLLAYRRFKSGQWFKDFAHQFGWYGSVRALETTWGEKNGWHPHLHEIVLFDYEDDIGLIENEIRKRWQAVLRKQGLDCDFHIGVKIRADNEYLAAYIAKFGREPLHVDRWTLAHELAKANVKRAKGEHGRTPFQLLADYTENADKQAGALFIEYTNAFKGRNHLVWSKGLKDALGVNEITDEEIAEQQDPTFIELTAIDYFTWRIICEQGVRGRLLAIAAKGKIEEVQKFIEKVVYFYNLNEERKVKKG